MGGWHGCSKITLLGTKVPVGYCCVGRSVTGAWMQEEYAGVDFAAAAVDAAMKTQKRINRYVTVM